MSAVNFSYPSTEEAVNKIMKANSRNEMWHWTNDEIGVELMAW